MSDLKSMRRALLRTALAASAVWLAACASNPAPVVNHSFGGSHPPVAPEGSAPAAAPKGGVQTFGLGAHAGGTVGANGYTVARGDTLYSIAFANGMDVRDLAALNGIEAPYTIHPGQVLKLKPGAASAPVAVAAPAAAAPAAGHAAGAPAASPPPAAPVQPEATSPPASSQPSAPVFGPVTQQTMTATGVAAAESAPPSPEPAGSIAGATMPPAAPTASTAAPPVAAAPASPAVPTPPPGASRSVAGIAWQWPASGKVIGGFQAGSGGDGAGLNIAGNAGDPVRAAAAGTVVYSGNGLIGYGELIIIKHSDTYLSAYGHNSKRLVSEGQRVGAGQEIALMGASGAPRVELHFEIRKDGKPVDPLGYLPAK